MGMEGLDEEILAIIRPAVWRRGMAVGMLGALGILLVWLALGSQEVSLGLRALFLGTGAAALAMAERIWRTTAVTLILTERGLHDSNGRELCQTENMEAVERSAFAFKPSNGFAIRLKHPLPRAWVPGLWWRFGKRLGVGGVVSKHQAKAMADFIALRLKPPPGF